MSTLIPFEQRTALPPGYTVRSATLDDAETVARLYTVSAQENGYGEIYSADMFMSEWTLANFKIEASTRLILANGTPAAFVIVWDRREPPIHPVIILISDPAYDDGTVTRWMLEWGLERAKQAIGRCPPEARVTAGVSTKHGYAPMEALLTEFGFTRARNFLRMRIDMTEAPDVPPLPDGLVLRPYRHPEHFDDIVRGYQEIFRDHYGHIDRPFADVRRDWLHEVEHDKHFDPTLWYVAVDAATGELAGYVLTMTECYDDPSVAYVDMVGVRREYRGRGLASALLKHAFRAFWQRGQHSVTLSVDSESRTGANRIYENVGMHIEHNYADYDLEIRPGVELSTTA